MVPTSACAKEGPLGFEDAERRARGLEWGLLPPPTQPAWRPVHQDPSEFLSSCGHRLRRGPWNCPLRQEGGRASLGPSPTHLPRVARHPVVARGPSGLEW